MREVSWSNPVSYLCWNTHVGKQLAAMLATKSSAGVTPEVNLKECISHTPPPSVNKAVYSGFETQRRHHQKSKTGISGPTKRTYVLQIFFKKKQQTNKTLLFQFLESLLNLHHGGVHQLITFVSTKLYSQQSTPQVNRRSMISMTLTDDCQLAFDKNIENRFSSERHNHCKRVDNIEITVPLFYSEE